MGDSAHIDFSEGESLESKARAYRKASQAHQDIESSIQHSQQDKEWSERLGSAQELDDAKKIIENSRIQAARSFSAEELQEAKDKEMLSHQEAKQIVVIKRKSEMKELEESRERSSSNSRSKGRSR